MDVQKEISFLGNLRQVKAAVDFLGENEYDNSIKMLMLAICELGFQNGSSTELIEDIESRSDKHEKSLQELVGNIEKVGFSEHPAFSYYALIDFIHDIYDYEDDSMNAFLWSMKKLNILEAHSELEDTGMEYLPQRIIHSTLGEIDAFYDELASLSAADAEACLREKGEDIEPIHVRLVHDKRQMEGIETYEFECDYLAYFEAVFGCKPESDKAFYILTALFDYFCKDKDLERSLTISRYLFDVLKNQKLYANMLGFMALLEQNFKLDFMNLEILLLSKYTINAALTLLEEGVEADRSIYRMIYCAGLEQLPLHWTDTKFYNDCVKRLLAQKPTNQENEEGQLRTELYTVLKDLYIKAISLCGDENYKLSILLNDSFVKLFGNPADEGIGKKNRPGSDALKSLDELQRDLDVQGLINKIMPDDDRNSPEMNILRARYLLVFEEYRSQFDTASVIELSTYIDYLLRPARYDIFSAEYIEENLKIVLPSFDAIDVSPNLHKYELNSIGEAAESLCAYYMEKGEAGLSLKYAVLSNKCSRHIYKRVLIEEGLEASVLEIQTDMDRYNVVLSIALTSLMSSVNSGINDSTMVNNVFTEIAIRKNLLVTVEKWAKRVSEATLSETRELINEEIEFDDICSSIPSDTVLIYFIYSRQRWFEVLEECPSETDKVASMLLRRQFLNIELKDAKLEADGNTICHCFTLDRNKTIGFHPFDETDKIKKHIDSLAKDKKDEKDGISFFKSLTSKILDDYQDKNRVFVASDGDFNNISFASLPYKDGFVIDSFAVRNIANVYELVNTTAIKTPKKALIVSVSEFGSGRLPSPLSGTKKEGEHVETVLTHKSISTDRLIDADATKDKISDSIKQNSYDIIHFSTHGDDETKELQIALFNANINKESFINVSDFDDIILNPPNLLFLSLCHGGAITANLQESVSGFIKSAIISGIQNIVAPLYEIPDEQTVLFCEFFYDKYLQENSGSIDESFRYALNKLKEIDSEGYWKRWVLYSREKA
jgi:hypothetical protein